MQVREWFLILRVFENCVPGKIFGFKGHGEIGDWRIFHNEEVHDFQSSIIFFRVIT